MRNREGLSVLMPSQVPTVDGDQSVEELRRELAEAREHATAEMKRLISSSATDLRRMFAVVAGSAVRLCDAYDAMIFQVHGSPAWSASHIASLCLAVCRDGCTLTPFSQRGASCCSMMRSPTADKIAT